MAELGIKPDLSNLPAGFAQTPVALPPEAAPAPVAPYDPVPVTRSILETNPVDQVNQHVAQFNAPALDSFAQKYKNTPEGQASAALAQRVKDGQSEYDNLMKGIQNAKTPQEANLAALKTYKTVRDEPRYGDALMMYIAGDKIGAMQTVMGGKIETKIEYLPTTGRMVIKKVNGLGQPVSVEDAQSGQIIPMPEYAKLGGSVSALENTLKFQSDKSTQKFRTDEFNNATKAFNGLNTLANAKEPLVQTYTNLMEEIAKNPQVNPNDLKLIAGFVSGQTSYARSLATGRDFIDSATRTKGNSLSAEDRKALGLGTGPVNDDQLKAALKAHAEYSLSDKAGNTYSANTLLQLMDRTNIGSQLDKNYTQDRKALEESTMLNLYKDRPDLYAKVKLAFDLNNQIQKINTDGAVTHGNPLFTVPTTAAGFTDPVQKVLAQAVQEKFNVQATQQFNKWRTQQMTMAREAGAVDYYPEPGELESQFTQTPLYKNMQKEASKEIVTTINRKPVYATESQIPKEVMTIGPAEEASMIKVVPGAVSPVGQANQQEIDAETERKAKVRNEALDKFTNKNKGAK